MRNSTLDTLRFFLAVLVLLVHVGSPLQIYYLPFTTIAVPCFFMLSGYLTSMRPNKLHISKSIKYTAKLLLGGNLLFAGFKIVHSIIFSDWEWLQWRKLYEFLLFNESPFGAHLWYIGAYLYVLIVMYVLCEKPKALSILRKSIPFLLMVNFVFFIYSKPIFGCQMISIYTRNWLFEGLPCFLIGYFMTEDTKEHLNCGILLMGGGILIIESFWLYVSYNVSTYGFYIGSVILSLAILRRCIQHGNNHESIFSCLGREYSLGIYILHPLIGDMFGIVGLVRKLPPLHYIYPLIVLFVTIGVLKFMEKVRQCGKPYEK